MILITSFLGINAQDSVINDSICHNDTILNIEKERTADLSDYPNSWGFVSGDIMDIDLRPNSVSYVFLSDSTKLEIFDEGIDGFELLNKDAIGKFALFIINYRSHVLRVDVVNWEEE